MVLKIVNNLCWFQTIEKTSTSGKGKETWTDVASILVNFDHPIRHWTDDDCRMDDSFENQEWGEGSGLGGVSDMGDVSALLTI